MLATPREGRRVVCLAQDQDIACLLVRESDDASNSREEDGDWEIDVQEAEEKTGRGSLDGPQTAQDLLEV